MRASSTISVGYSYAKTDYSSQCSHLQHTTYTTSNFHTFQHPYLHHSFYPGPHTQVLPMSDANASVHSIDQSTVVNVVYDSGLQENISTKSSILFAVLFDPYNNTEVAMKGYKFHKISELFQLPILPPILWARQSYYGSSPEYSVSANELLIVRGVKSTLVDRQQLKVYSHTQHKEKTLCSTCFGSFSTKPRDIALFLSDILQHMTDVFPCKAVMFNSEARGGTCIVTLMHSSIDTSPIYSHDLPNYVHQKNTGESRRGSAERSLGSGSGDNRSSPSWQPPLLPPKKIRRDVSLTQCN